MFGGAEKYDHVDLEFKAPSADEEKDTAISIATTVKDDSTSDDEKLSCCARLRWELSSKSAWFLLEEPGRVQIDVEKSFATRNFLVVLLRLFCVSWSASAFAAHLYTYPEAKRRDFGAYLSHWSWCAVMAYQITVLSLCVLPRGIVLRQPLEGDPPSLLIRLTMFLYSVAAPTQLLLFYIFIVLHHKHTELKTEDGNTGNNNPYLNIMEHFVLTAMLLFDGNVLAVVPVKLKHIVFAQTFLSCYTVWTLLHDLGGVGTVGEGIWRGVDSDEGVDWLYPFFNWRHNFVETIVFVFVGILVACPVAFLFLWVLSMLHYTGFGKKRPRYGGQYVGDK